MINYKSRLKDIKAVIFDFDGVLSDGKILVLPDGEQLRYSSVKDGYALQLAVKKGLKIVVISGGKSESMIRRFEALGITDYFLDVSNKKYVFDEYLKQNNLDYNQILYMGDDIPDYEIMKLVSIATCPADAVEEIINISHYISKFNGGNGAARDVLEQVMKIQNLWFDNDAFHW